MVKGICCEKMKGCGTTWINCCKMLKFRMLLITRNDDVDVSVEHAGQGEICGGKKSLER
jgi:hypothetical protein